MSVIACKECGNQVSSNAAACPGCGAKVPRPPRTKWWLWIPLALIWVLFVVGAMNRGESTSVASQKGQDRRAISLCWEEQKRKSLPSDQQRFIAGACELMERSFAQKYGLQP